MNLEKVLPELYKFILNTIGAKYTFNIATLTCMKSSFNENKEKQKGYFCSELIASAYKEIGILSLIKSSTSYWPRSFSSQHDKKELNLYDNAHLHPE